MQKVNQTEAYQNFDEICNQVIATRQPVEITRENAESVSLISTSELNSLMETVYLFSSRENAVRLLDALGRAEAKINQPRTIKDLCEEFGIDEEETEKISA